LKRLLRLATGLAVAIASAFACFTFAVVGGYGVMWLFIFGDSTWPPAAERFAQYGLPAIGLVAGLIAGIAIIRAIAFPQRETPDG